jgi:hypothetical protein
LIEAVFIVSACHFLYGEDGRKPVDSNHEGNNLLVYGAAFVVRDAP